MNRILLIDQNPEDFTFLYRLNEEVCASSFALEQSSSFTAGLQRLQEGDIDVVLLDASILNGRELGALTASHPELETSAIILLLSTEDTPQGMEAILGGALDYLVKTDLTPALFSRAVRYAADRKRLARVMERRAHHLDLLNRASQAFASSLDMEEVLTSILEEIRQDLNAVHCAIWLIDARADELVCKHSTGSANDTVIGWRLPLGKGLAGWAARNNQSLLVPDTRLDRRHYTGVQQAGGLELRSNVTVPLRIKETVIGVIQVVDTQPNRFSALDLELVETLAPTAAIAIENARLYEETKRLAAFNEDIVQGMEGGITIEDEHGIITFVNPKMANLLGHEPEELQGQHWRSMLLPTETEKMNRHDVSSPETPVNRYETVLLSADRRHVPVLVSARPIIEGTEFTGILSVITDITERKRAERALEQLNLNLEQLVRERTRELELAYDTTLEGLVQALEFRDHETEGHSRRVTELTMRLARAIGIKGQSLENVRRGAILHDIGKLGVPDSILLKPGPLSDEEWETMRMHPVYARRMLESIPFLAPALDIPYSHHEKWDGTGYPEGLAGEGIPLAARVFAIVDVWDALISDRPYRAAMSKTEAIQIIRKGSGSHFQPQVVDLFLVLLEDQ